MINIRLAKKEDSEKILQIYGAGRQRMREDNNFSQWINSYPNQIEIDEGLANKNLYVYEQDGEVVATFCFVLGGDKTYDYIENGHWNYDLPYGVIHRLAALPKVKNVGKNVLNYCKSQINYLRVDTHKDNNIMRHIIENNGFKYCGIIYVEDGTPRLAYDYYSYPVIYLAGGCFWGVDHYYSLLKGVIKTKSGYGNGNIANPAYEQLKSGEANHAETVEVIYDPKVISLEKILEHYLRFIEPYNVDRQGHDVGHQYRSGIYYVEKEDESIIRNYLDSHLDKGYKIEVLPLENFYDAEEYHQQYLYKNPQGYCHIDMKLISKDEKK